jgi:hypothetical protein
MSVEEAERALGLARFGGRRTVAAYGQGHLSVAYSLGNDKHLGMIYEANELRIYELVAVAGFGSHEPWDAERWVKEPGRQAP